jgi:hypothetical protein
LRQLGDFLDPGSDVAIHGGKCHVLRGCGHGWSLEESLIGR